MKKLITLSTIAIIFAFSSSFALPNFWFSGVAYNTTGQVLPGTPVEVLINLTDGANTFSEQFVSPSTILTDAFGIFSVQVGTGAGLGGSLLAIQMKSNTQLTVQVRTVGGSWVTINGASLTQAMLESKGTALAFVLPNIKGDNHQVLTSNGTGGTYWGEPTDWANPGVIGSTTPNSAAFTEAIVGNSLANKNPNAALEVNSSSKAFLMPRLTATQRDAIQVNSPGLLIYNITANKVQATVLGGVTLDQSQTVGGWSSGGIHNYQSFTPGFSGKLNSIEINCSNPRGINGIGYLKVAIYKGEVFSGAYLSHGPDFLGESPTISLPAAWGSDWRVFDFSSLDITLQKDVKYTFDIVVQQVDYSWLNLNINNPYSRGVAYDGTWDYLFRTNMLPLQWTDLN